MIASSDLRCARQRPGRWSLRVWFAVLVSLAGACSEHSTSQDSAASRRSRDRASEARIESTTIDRTPEPHVSAATRVQFTSLHDAAAAGDTDAVRSLLASGTAPDTRDPEDDWTPLHSAAQDGRTAVVSLLLSKGADPNARTRYNQWTALHLAALHGHAETARVLLEQGARANLRGSAGFQAYQLATMEGHADLASILEAASMNASSGPAMRNAAGTTSTGRDVTLIYAGPAEVGEIFVPESFGSVFSAGHAARGVQHDGLEIAITGTARIADEYETAYVITNRGSQTRSIRSSEHVIFDRFARQIRIVRRMIAFELSPGQDEVVRFHLGAIASPRQMSIRVDYADGSASVFAIYGLEETICMLQELPTFAEFQTSRSLCH